MTDRQAEGVKMRKHIHEIRDPIHVFIRLESLEREVLNSRPVQRLRHIHQLALTYLVYPGATHKRLEHSLGVMELAGRVYDVVTNPANIQRFPSVRDIVPDHDSMDHAYWRRVVRMAALCHDIGHLPFSHAAEDDLLPTGWDHEKLTIQLILADELRNKWKALKIAPEHVAKLAVGAQKVHRRAIQRLGDNALRNHHGQCLRGRSHGLSVARFAALRCRVWEIRSFPPHRHDSYPTCIKHTCKRRCFLKCGLKKLCARKRPKRSHNQWHGRDRTLSSWG